MRYALLRHSSALLVPGCPAIVLYGAQDAIVLQRLTLAFTIDLLQTTCCGKRMP